jgi:hypothetical protein
MIYTKVFLQRKRVRRGGNLIDYLDDPIVPDPVTRVYCFPAPSPVDWCTRRAVCRLSRYVGLYIDRRWIRSGFSSCVRIPF